jgi:general secretion pathway protein D
LTSTAKQMAACLVIASAMNAGAAHADVPLLTTAAFTEAALGQFGSRGGSEYGRQASGLVPQDSRTAAYKPVDPFVAARGGSQATTSPAKQTAAAHLARGKAALEQRNFMAALEAYKQAASQGATFAPGEYSPASLAADLNKAGVMVPAIAPPRSPAPVVAARPSAPAGLAPRTPTNRPAPAAAPTVSARQHAFSLLRQARVSLAKGDTAAADKFVAEADAAAKRGNVVFQDSEDSPVNVKRMIARINQIAQSPAGADDAVFTRHFAQVLVEQADWLGRYGERGHARQLAERAKDLDAEFAPGAMTPDVILAKLDGRPVPVRSIVPPTADNPRKPEAVALAARAQAALDRGNVREAYTLANDARRLGVPAGEFGPDDINPYMLLMKIERESAQRSNRVQPAGAVVPATGTGSNRVARTVYDPATDRSRNQPAQALNTPPTAPFGTAPQVDPAQLVAQADAALKKQDFAAADRLFREAWKHERNMDPQLRQRVQEHLQLTHAANIARPEPRRPAGPLAELDEAQQVELRKLWDEIARVRAEAGAQLQTEPLVALQRLEELRAKVESSELTPAARQRLLTTVNTAVAGAKQYVEANRERITAAQENADTRAAIEDRYTRQAAVNHELSKLVDEFNMLMDQQRYAEAEVISRQARAIAPDHEVTVALTWKSRFASRMQANLALQMAKEEGVIGALQSVEESSIAFDDRNPYRLPEAKQWSDLTKSRLARLRDQGGRISPTELKIRTALSQPVRAEFNKAPLAEVMNTLAAMSGVNIHLDPQGLAAEGITSDREVTLSLTQGDVTLKSALSIILRPMNLSYVIQDEVLKITSAQLRDADTYTVVYDVADLVIPIPNFVPSHDIGLPGAIASAYAATGYGPMAQGGGQVPINYLADNGSAAPGGSALAQLMGGAGQAPSMAGGTRSAQPLGYGPGGMGGGSAADFDTLIDLITSTIAPTTWSDVGGPGSVEGFETNLSLVVSQTQEVHEDIVDLLEQLRRLQDLQVTIEVRFINLQDNFFERIGVDFDFDLDDGLGSEDPDDIPDHGGPSVSVGLDPQGLPTADLDLQFTQGSFGSAVPAFGGFDAATAANFGFAIISEIEAFFVIQAAQGDTRTNVMQAPKVTLFNGQQAFVSDTSQRPFVTSVVPVVGDFAAAQQPVIVVLNEGTSLSVQAVVSPDRRFVRLTLVPFFSRIGDVETFTFQGQTSSSSGTTVPDPVDDQRTVQDNATNSTNGTTVQLPTFSFVTVTTTVSVPDGGTVLLGGIKRLSEGRNERGVPVLSKVPYVNRLFRNVGIGRTTQSLMMMVTPRIIIQEEEEERIGLQPTN